MTGNIRSVLYAFLLLLVGPVRAELALSDSFNIANLYVGLNNYLLNEQLDTRQAGTGATNAWVKQSLYQAAGVTDILANDYSEMKLRIYSRRISGQPDSWEGVYNECDFGAQAAALGNAFQIDCRALQGGENDTHVTFTLGAGVNNAVYNYNTLSANDVFTFRIRHIGTTAQVLVDAGNDGSWDVNTWGDGYQEQYVNYRIIGRPNGDGTTTIEVYYGDLFSPFAEVVWNRELDEAPAFAAFALRGGKTVSSIGYFDSFSFDVANEAGLVDPVITGFVPESANSAALWWRGSREEVFSVYRSDNLVTGEWACVASNLPAAPIENGLLVDLADRDSAYYRVGVDWVVNGNPLDTSFGEDGSIALRVEGSSTPVSGQFAENTLTVPDVPANLPLFLEIAAQGNPSLSNQILVDNVRVWEPKAVYPDRFSFESGDFTDWTDNFGGTIQGGVFSDGIHYDAATPDGSHVAWLSQSGGGAAITRALGSSSSGGTWTVAAAIGERNDLPLAESYSIRLLADTDGDGEPDKEIGASNGDTTSTALVQPSSIDWTTFQIDLMLNPLEDPDGNDDLYAGITFGLPGPFFNPLPVEGGGSKVSWVLRERLGMETLGPHSYREKRGYWQMWVDGVNKSLEPNPPNGDWDNGTGQMPYNFLPHEGAYHLRIVCVPHEGGSLLRFYFEDMMRPVEEYQVERTVTPGFVAFFTERLGGWDGRSIFNDYSIRPISETEALRTYGSTEYVMNLLDLDYPGLEGVKTAWLAGDTNLAQSLFIEHMRTRSEPVGPALDPSYYVGNYLQVANNACDGIYGWTTWYGPDWSNMTYSVSDPRIHWDLDHGYLNRMYHWVSLAKAYEVTGDEKYASRFGFEVSDWVDREPFYHENNPDTGYIDCMDGTKVRVGWLNTSNVGRRCEQTWWMAFDKFRSSTSMPADAIFKYLDGVIRQSHLIFNPSVFGVWDDGGAHVTAALMQNGAMFPECIEASEWKTLAQDRMRLVNEAQIYDDGAHASLSTGYGFSYYVSANAFLDILTRTGEPLPQDLLDDLERAYEWPMAISRPDRKLIHLNDGNAVTVPASYYQQAYALFPGRQDFRWFAANETEGSPPPYTSKYMPNAGWIMMRTGWGSLERWFFMDAGPFGASHGKDDKLGIWLAQGPKMLLQSGGRSGYSVDWTPWAVYTVSSRARNVVHIDDNREDRIHNTDEIYGYEPEHRRWHSDAAFDYAEGFYNHADSLPARAAPWMRQVVHVKGDNPPETSYWLVFDDLQPDDGAHHAYKALFHSMITNAVVTSTNNPIVDLTDAGAGLRIVPLAVNENLEASLVRGQEYPPYKQGWYVWADKSITTEQWCVTYDWDTTGNTTKGWVLVPAYSGQDWLVSATNMTADPGTGIIQARLNRSDGGTDWVLRRPPGSGVTNLAGLSITGDVAVVRMDASNNVQNVFQTELMPQLTVEVSTNSQVAFFAETDDLANQNLATFGSISDSTYVAAAASGPLTKLFDGTVGESGDQGDTCLGEGDAPYSFVINFDTSTHVNGYDISEIRTMAGWENQRARQNILIEYRMVGESGFSFLCKGYQGWFEINPTMSTRLTWKNALGAGIPMVEHVAALKIHVLDFYSTSGSTAMLREIDVLGSPRP